MSEIENFMYRNDQEGIKSHESHQNSSLAYLPPKVAIAVLRFPPLTSRISIIGYAKKCIRTHRWPLGLFLFLIRHMMIIVNCARGGTVSYHISQSPHIIKVTLYKSIFDDRLKLGMRGGTRDRD